MAAVQTTCPYCGVGCGVVVDAGVVRGDAAHPANRGRLCAKGAALGATLGDAGRLTVPRLFGQPASWDAALDRIAATFRQTIAAHGPDSVAFYVSGQMLTEDYYVANKLMKGFIGSANIDTNSRLCMASSVAGHVRAFGEDVVPGVYEDFEDAALVVLVGSNAAWCHPVLHQRLAAARAARRTRVVVIDPRRTATAEGADLFLPIAPGSDVLLFQGLLVHLARAGAIDRDWTGRHTAGLAEALAAACGEANEVEAVAAECGVDPEALQTLYDWFAATERVVTAFSQGVNQAEDGTDRVNAIINCHLATGRIGRPGMGPFSLTGQPNAMGGREVGGLATQLAAHLRFDSAAERAALRSFWRAPRLASTPGLTAVEMFRAVADGRIKAIWIAATNPAATLPRAAEVRAALSACPFVVVADCWETDTTRLGHAVLPAAGWGEKDGTVTNSERRISRQRAHRAAPGAARADWWMFAELGRRMGWAAAFAWAGPAGVFREHAALSAHAVQAGRVFDLAALADLDDGAYAALAPVRWPLDPHGGEGGRLFARGGFPTADGRARLVALRWRGRPAAAPFLLNTGRVRDQWHTMTRTGRVAALAAHTPEPSLAIHPADAARLGVVAGGLVRVESEAGAVVLRAEPTHAQRRGEVFAPMHWTAATNAAGPVGQMVIAALDPHSHQPALKATPVRLAAVAATYHGMLLRAEEAPPPACGHWVRIALERGWLWRLAGLAGAPDAAMLLAAPDGAEVLEMADPARGVRRMAAITDGRLAAILVLARDAADLPGEQRFAALLGDEVSASARVRLLAGGGAASEEGPRVCACFGVTRAAVRHAAVTHRLRSVAEIGATLGAGSNCGSCIPELERILADVRAPAI